MTNDISELINTVARIIEDHIEKHPNAADSTDGIVRWWLPQQLNVPLPILEEALNILVLENKLQKTIVPGGKIVFSKSSK